MRVNSKPNTDMKTYTSPAHLIRRSIRRAFIAAALLLFALGSPLSTHLHAQGGSLTPPPGAPGPTMKSLAQIEPRTDLANVAGDAGHHHIISTPGSYYLSGNLDVTKADGISIQASDVTLDLQGFNVNRIAGAGGVGILIANSANRVVIQNGSVAGFAKGVGGALGGGQPGLAGRLSDMAASACTESGLEAGPGGWVVEGCVAQANIGAGSVIGIRAGNSALVRACTAISNKSTGSGCIGIYCNQDTVISECVANGNQGATLCIGIFVSSSGVLTNCAGCSNSAYVTGKCSGIYGGGGSTLRDCIAASRFSQSGECRGFDLGDDVTMTGCHAHQNIGVGAADPALNGAGICVGFRCSITACSATNNKADGIRVQGASLVVNCSSSGNGTGGTGSGVHTIQSGNRIEGNNLADNITGLKVDGTRSLIIRNSAYSNNTSYVIAATNKVGVIVVAPDSGAINGSSGGAGLGSTDPAANFTY